MVLEHLPVCGNCHSFSSDGAVLGMDVDYANDKGAYVIRSVAEEMALDKDQIITWSDYRREDNERTFGLLSQVSPDGRHVVSTVKDRSVFVATDDLTFSQLFFPIKGILAVYDRQAKTFRALPGAEDRQFVQSNPAWSPDGKYIVFARSRAYRLQRIRDEREVLLSKEECEEFLQGRQTLLFDLYRIPFNGGKGGKAQPLVGASDNGVSNYFPKYSPDGKWIVFCRAKSFMLLQPDSELYIIPAEGGEARRMRCNTSRMNSWHSWSPNGRWLVFSSKANSPYTQLFLSHVDADGNSTPAVLLSQFTAPDRAANIPEFVNTGAAAIRSISARFVDDASYVQAGRANAFAGEYELAVRSFRKALEINPDNLDAYESWGVLLLRQGKIEEAKSFLLKVLDHQPDRKDAHCQLGIALGRQGEREAAIRHLREAARLDPAFALPHLQLGTLLLDQGDLEQAKNHLAESLRLDGRNSAANCHYGIALVREGLHGRAAAYFRRALANDPNHVEALLRLAILCATSNDPAIRNGEQAVTLATNACELTRYQDPRPLMTLSAVYGELGRRSDSLSAAQAALRAARAAGNEALAETIQRQLRGGRQPSP